MSKRVVELVVISDVHLGTYGCQAAALNDYLKSIRPEILVLNGDIIDIWQFSKRYWPKSHMKVIQRIFKLLSTGTKVYYLTGNHDEMMRKFSGSSLGNLEIQDKLILHLDGHRMWFFHGDVFDVTMKHSKWLAKLGGIGYDVLILLNSMVNRALTSFGKERVSFSKKIKQSVKQAVSFIDDFESTAIEIAIDNGFTHVICGHIHQPQIRQAQTERGSVTYLNSGDWIENLTALEYHHGKWSVHHHEAKAVEHSDDEFVLSIPDNFALLQSIIRPVRA